MALLGLDCGAYYLARIKKSFDTEDHDLVAAAYNHGPGAVRKAIREGYYPNTPMQHYIAKIADAKEKGYA